MKPKWTVPRKPFADKSAPGFFKCDIVSGGTRVAAVTAYGEDTCYRFAKNISATLELLAAAKEALATLQDENQGLTSMHPDDVIPLLRVAITKAETGE